MIAVRTLGGILIGMLYSSTMIKNMKNSSLVSGLPGVIEIKHCISGRVRFHVPSIKQDKLAEEKLLFTIKNIDAIEKIEINIITASILVYYKEDEVTPEIILGIIVKILELETFIEEKRNPAVLREIKNFNEALNYSVYKRTKGTLDFKTLVPLIFIFFGIKNIYTKKGGVSPNPYSLLYWAYKSLCL